MFNTIKKYIKVIVLILLGLSILSTCILFNRYKDTEDKLAIAISNEKAFSMENSQLKDKNRVFQFRIDQLDYYNDSLLEEMNKVRKELKIKDKELEQLQYLLSQSSKTDTIVFRDTIFSDPTLYIDTILGDKWYNLELKLKYPSTIVASPSFTNETNIVWSIKKETINPPHKCWLVRLFQKKHKVLTVDVVESNPYTTVKKSRFIEIVK